MTNPNQTSDQENPISEKKDEQTEESKPLAVDTGKRVDVSGAQQDFTKTTRRREEAENQGGQAKKLQDARATHRPKNKPHFNKQKNETQRRDASESKPLLSGTSGKTVINGHAVEPIEQSTVHFAAPEPKVWDDTGDFAAMLGEMEPVERLNIEVGNKVRAKLIHVTKDSAFFAIGKRHEGVMPLVDLIDEQGELNIALGDFIEAFVVEISDGIKLSKKLSRHMTDLSMLEEAKNTGMPVEGKVLSVNPGGFEVAIAGAKAFCPVSQIDVNFVEDTASWVGKVLPFLVTQIAEGGRKIVLSRRKLLERDRDIKGKERLATLKVGDQTEGIVTRLMDFGAFVDLGGIEGLVPLSELGYGMRASVQDYVKVGERVRVEVRRIEPNPKREGQMRVSLSLKATLVDPYTAHKDQLIEGAHLEGKVVRLESFGAFVELFPGLEGLIHISELSDKRIRHPSEILKVGDAVTVRILNVDHEKRRIGLSLRENVERGVAQPTKTYERGNHVEGTVERVERYGVFVRLEGGQSALLPASESGLPKGADLHKAFEIGAKLPLLVIDVDERGRLRVSAVAREQAEERALLDKYKQSQGSKGGQKGLGTLADLLKQRNK